MRAKKTTGRLCNSLYYGIHGDIEGEGTGGGEAGNSELSFGPEESEAAWGEFGTQ